MTQLGWPTMLNSRDQRQPTSMSSSEKFGHHRNVNFLAGLLFIICQACGWPNTQIYHLCHLRPESGIYLFKDCRFTRRIWVEIACWLGDINLHPDAWVASNLVSDWWSTMDYTICVPKQGLRSLTILVCWEVWKERNVRIFGHIGMPNHLLLQKIKDEAQLWISAGAKHLARLVQRFWNHPSCVCS
jgi:hypothetical protein